MLKVKGINVFYDEVQILRGVSFEVEKGMIVSLLGSNGAGKTTTVNAISGVLPCKSGFIEFMGKDITNLEPYLRVEMGLVQVPEGRKIFPSLTVVENLEMGSYLKKPKLKRKETMDLVMEMFPILSKRKKQFAGTLSGGEQQMLAIARGLMSLPKLLILDEPSLGLAPLIVEEIFKVIKKINSEGVTILLVEQNVAQSLSISDRSFILEEGRIALSGKGEELLQNAHIKKLYLGL